MNWIQRFSDQDQILVEFIKVRGKIIVIRAPIRGANTMASTLSIPTESFGV
jgi:hypothetical protein